MKVCYVSSVIACAIYLAAEIFPGWLGYPS